ncbi:MAG: glycosyltransferase [Candidatus Lokiarchaeota archaeon]|nr:glycosyltransferase [Candidatus Lokiarchaeota archaeon]
MVRLRSIAWSLWALAFIIICIPIVGAAIIWIFDAIQNTPNFLYTFLFWPLDPAFGFFGYFGTFAWWCFLVGFVFFVGHFLKKIFRKKKFKPIILKKGFPIDLSTKKIIIVIPAFNEEKTIEDVINGCKKHSENIIVVNDGSNDKTEEIAYELGATVISFYRNRGLGNAMKTGLKEALREEADIVITIDGDAQYKTEEIPKLLEVIEKNQADLVLGSRFLGKIEKMSATKRLGNKVFAWMVRNVTGLPLKDPNTGFRVIKSEVIKSINLSSSFTYTQEMILRSVEEGFRVREVPVTFRKREKGGSRLMSDPAEYGIRASIILFRTFRDYHPIALFGFIGVVILLSGVLLGVYNVYYSFLLATPLSIGQILLAALLMLAGIQILCTGLIADMYSSKEIKES